MLGALAFFKGQKTNPSRRQDSIQLMENAGLEKSRCMPLYTRIIRAEVGTVVGIINKFVDLQVYKHMFTWCG